MLLKINLVKSLLYEGRFLLSGPFCKKSLVANSTVIYLEWMGDCKPYLISAPAPHTSSYLASAECAWKKLKAVRQPCFPHSFAVFVLTKVAPTRVHNL